MTVNDPLVCTQTAADLQAAFVGRRVVALRRRGKYLIIELEGVLLVVHLRMTGRLLLAPEPGDRAPRFVVRLRPDAELLFYDTRRFGRVWAVPAADENTFFAALGPEPFSAEFTSGYLRRALEGRSTPLKSFLLDQRRIAGVGNIYADEALFRARLHPLRTAGTLGPGEIERLRDALLETLQLGIEHAGAWIDTFVDPGRASGDFQAMLNVYGRTGEPCRVLRRADRTGRARRARHAFLPGLDPAARQAIGRRRPRGAGRERAARDACAAGRGSRGDGDGRARIECGRRRGPAGRKQRPVRRGDPGAAPRNDRGRRARRRHLRPWLAGVRGQRATWARRPCRAPPPRRKPLRWHADYLFTRHPATRAWLLDTSLSECEVAALLLAAAPGAATRPHGPRFGASDCGCAGHLVGVARLDALRTALGVAAARGGTLRALPVERRKPRLVERGHPLRAWWSRS